MTHTTLSEDSFVLAHDKNGSPLILDASKTFRCVLAGSSGSGKTATLKALLCGYARLGASYQAVVLNPKIVGFASFAPRFHIFDDPEQLPEILDLVVEEMFRRYKFARSQGWEDDWQTSPANPQLLVVCDEVAQLLANRRSKNDFTEERLTQLASLSRQAGMSLVIAGQTISSEVMTTQIRNNLDIRICLRTDSEIQTNLIVEEGFDAPAHLIPYDHDLIGLGYFKLSNTQNQYKLGRSVYVDAQTIAQTMEETAKDKAPLEWLYEEEAEDDDL